jgi:hypothetical protein
MKLHSVVLAVLFVSIITLGGLAFVGGLENKHSVNLNETYFNKTESRMDDVINVSGEIRDKVTNLTLSEGESTLLIPYRLIQVGWNVIRISWSTMILIPTMFAEGFTSLGDLGLPIPDWLVGIVFAVVIIIIVFILVYAFFRWKMEDK